MMTDEHQQLIDIRMDRLKELDLDLNECRVGQPGPQPPTRGFCCLKLNKLNSEFVNYSKKSRVILEHVPHISYCIEYNFI